MVRILIPALLAAALAACSGTPESRSGAQSDTGMANPATPVPAQVNPQR
jgi:uncharacterized lipoprotein